MAFVAYNAQLGRIFGFGTRLVKKIAAGGQAWRWIDGDRPEAVRESGCGP